MTSPTEYQAVRNLTREEQAKQTPPRKVFRGGVIHYDTPKKHTFWEFMKEQLTKEETKHE